MLTLLLDSSTVWISAFSCLLSALLSLMWMLHSTTETSSNNSHIKPVWKCSLQWEAEGKTWRIHLGVYPNGLSFPLPLGLTAVHILHLRPKPILYVFQFHIRSRLPDGSTESHITKQNAAWTSFLRTQRWWIWGKIQRRFSVVSLVVSKCRVSGVEGEASVPPPVYELGF